MSEEDMRKAWILARDKLIEGIGIVKHLLPAILIRKPPLLSLAHCKTMATMILSVYRETQLIEILCKGIVSRTMLSHSMIDMECPFRVISRPVSEEDTVAIRSFKIAFFHNFLLSKSNCKDGH